MTDQAFRNRATHLAAWLADQGWSIAEIRRETEDVYDDEDFDRPRRFVIVEKLELPGHDARIVSTTDTEDAAQVLLVYLLDSAPYTNWYPRAVLDLDTNEELTWELSVRFTRTMADD